MITESEVLVVVSGLSAERLTTCVTQRWVRPRQSETGAVYDETDVARLRLILELTEDFEVNDEGIPLILNLIDEATTLRHHLRALCSAVGSQRQDVLDEVLERIDRD